jgi:hypothetical protein
MTIALWLVEPHASSSGQHIVLPGGQRRDSGRSFPRRITSSDLTRNPGHESLTEVFGPLRLIPVELRGRGASRTLRYGCQPIHLSNAAITIFGRRSDGGEDSEALPEGRCAQTSAFPRLFWKATFAREGHVVVPAHREGSQSPRTRRDTASTCVACTAGGYLTNRWPVGHDQP